MILSELPRDEVPKRLAGPGIAFKTGPFNFRVKSSIGTLARGMALLYADYPLLDASEFVDFDVLMDQGAGLRRWLRGQVLFRFDGALQFEPLPISHAFPLLEWSMNWCISTQCHQYLTLHAAVIERGGNAVILPAPPGSGKSTLCAGLVNRGWRLLSDELTLVSTADLQISPLCRPVSLKNQSISIIKAFEPSAVFGDVTPDTSKGAVCHMKVASEHLRRMNDVAKPTWVVFPKFVAGSKPVLTPRPRADSLLELGRNSFNYGLLGRLGFETMAEVVDKCDCYDFSYGNLNEAIDLFDALAGARGT